MRTIEIDNADENKINKNVKEEIKRSEKSIRGDTSKAQCKLKKW